jgi:hypothetical protein
MAQSSPEGIVLGKGSQLGSMELSINKEKVLSIKQEKKYTEEDLRKAIDFIPYHLEHGNLVARLSDKDVEDFIKNLKHE